MISLTIHPEKKIESIQLQFRKIFPFLNIECFTHPHSSGEGTARNKMIPVSVRLSECMKTSTPVTIDFLPSTTVRQFEEQMRSAAGLNVQVFRKAGKLWLETSVTDSWTLQQQNEEGKISSDEIKEDIESADDHDIY